MSARGAVAMPKSVADGVLIRRWHEGVSMKDLAVILDLSVKTIECRVRRLRRQGIELPRRDHPRGSRA